MNYHHRQLLLIISVLLLGACARRETTTTAPLLDAPAAPAPGSTATTPTTSPDSSVSATTSSATTAPALATPATKSGWWIRINPNLTTAPAITLQIGTNKLNREEWLVWRAGQPTEFDVPAKYQQSPRLYLRGSVTPIGKKGDLCMMYKDHGVEHLDFKDDESEAKPQTAVDFKCR